MNVNDTPMLNSGADTYPALGGMEKRPILLIRKAARDLEHPNEFSRIHVNEAESMVLCIMIICPCCKVDVCIVLSKYQVV
jgi:hypothetical protein